MKLQKSVVLRILEMTLHETTTIKERLRVRNVKVSWKEDCEEMLLAMAFKMV